jgi:pimeloyl-ACP methyl ester carboxylesterase
MKTPNLHVVLVMLTAIVTLGGAAPSRAAEQPVAKATEAEQPKMPPPVNVENVPTPTLGGLQYWGDELFFHQWRIQRHASTGRCRLLDPASLRHASGTLEECRAALDQIKRDRKLPPMKGKAVVVLHGLARSRACMASLCKHLETHGDYEVFNVEYPSTQRAIGEDARALASILANLDGIEEIHFVAHSLGNIVVRHYVADQTDPKTGRRPDPRIKRMVMLGPPNHGSSIAAALGDNTLFKMVLGQPGQELGRHWAWEEVNLATPQFEFGIIAGGLGNRQGFNPLLPGDDDGVVPVEGTRLAGASDFVVVPVVHLALNDDMRVFQYVLRFLQRGYFISADRRQPIAKQ